MANDVSAKLEVLRQRFRDKAVDEIDVLTGMIRAIRSGHSGSDDIASAYRLLHRLAGSAGTFGLSRLGEEARSLELRLKPLAESDQDLPPAPSIVDDEFCQRLETLRPLLDARDSAETGAHPLRSDMAGDDQVALIVEPDQGRAQQMMNGLALYGYAAQWLASVEGWQDKITQAPSVVVIRDELFLANSGHFAQSFAALPIICVGANDSFARRYALAREGAEAFFSEPLNVPVLADHLERLLSDHADAASGRVLIVDDDPELLEHYRLVLTSGGMEARTVGDPSTLPSMLSEFCPDILLMDVQMGEFAGPALARMLRFEQEWLSLPIIYLSSESDPELQLEALAKGGDDFLTKPVSDLFLLRTVRVRCYRAKQLDKLVSRDSLTGLLKHSVVKSEVVKVHARCQRMKHVSVVAMLDLDHFKQVNDNQGHRAGDLVIKGLANLLRHRLRKTDIIGRYGGEEFIAALPECDMDKAIEVFTSVCDDFSKIVFRGNSGKFSVTLSVGVSALSDYDHSEDAIEAADQALYERKRMGRNGVTGVSSV
jgi:diguanylate cyclase (GGDEF)-like protein